MKGREKKRKKKRFGISPLPAEVGLVTYVMKHLHMNDEWWFFERISSHAASVLAHYMLLLLRRITITPTRVGVMVILTSLVSTFVVCVGLQSPVKSLAPFFFAIILLVWFWF